MSNLADRLRALADEVERLEREITRLRHAFEVLKAEDEQALAADRAVERALGRQEGAAYVKRLLGFIYHAKSHLDSHLYGDPAYAIPDNDNDLTAPHHDSLDCAYIILRHALKQADKDLMAHPQNAAERCQKCGCLVSRFQNPGCVVCSLIP